MAFAVEVTRTFAASEINRGLIEHQLLGLPQDVVKGIYLFGSHAFGTATPQSGMLVFLRLVLQACPGPKPTKSSTEPTFTSSSSSFWQTGTFMWWWMAVWGRSKPMC